MHLIYIDDSGDEKIGVLFALVVPDIHFVSIFRQIRDFRRSLKQKYGIFVHKEFHASEFVSGRGKISNRTVTKYERCEIFKESLRLLSSIPEIKFFNAVFPAKEDERAFERLLNRINRTMSAWNSLAMLFIDEGKELQYTKIARRLSVFNPIPSKYATWLDSGQQTKNITTELIIEDPIFKKSQRSYFIQLADFCAYSLLRRENPIPSKSKYGIDVAFNILKPILITAAVRKDPEGIIRL